ncbi:MAG: flagellar motor protein MotB [Pseudomonadota bacterium]
MAGSRRRKKAQPEGGHGGSWKVAYADFVTAMMAFFLLMWLLNMSSAEKRARLSYYFKNFSIFEKSGDSALGTGDSGKKGIYSMLETDITETDVSQKEQKGETSAQEEITKKIKKEDLQQDLKNLIDHNLGDVKNQVLVDVFEGGVRVQLTDTEGELMFPVGSTSLTSKAKEILKVITGQNIKNFSGKIAIEGHTDARPYPSEDYTNWELSTERASAARRAMGEYGLDPSKIIRVTGFADKDPLIKNDPYDPRNRRISILLYATFARQIKQGVSSTPGNSDNLPYPDTTR